MSSSAGPSRVQSPTGSASKSPTFFKSSGEHANTSYFARRGSSVVEMPSALRCTSPTGNLIRSSKRSDIDLVPCTTYRRSMMDSHGQQSGNPDGSPSFSPSEAFPAHASSRDDSTIALSVNRQSAATQAALVAKASSKKSGRSMFTSDGATSLVELTRHASCTSPVSASTRSPQSAKGPGSPKKDRFGAMLVAARTRCLSVESCKVLTSLEEYYAKYVAYEKEMRALVAAVNAGEVNPGEAKTKLALLETDLAKLQSTGIDSVKTSHLGSGQEACKKARKELNLKAERMLNYIESIFPLVTERVSIYFSNLEAASARA